MMRIFFALLFAWAAWPGVLSGQWETASPNRRIEFPRDHHVHWGFKTEWWYFTGNLEAENGRHLGYQLTFFRQGLRAPGSVAVGSVWVRDWFAFAHFAVSDAAGQKFRHGARFVRGGFGDADFPESGERIVRIADWTADRSADDRWRLRASEPGFALDVELRPLRPPVLQGQKGYSRKGETEDRASMYYSHTRMETRGTLRLGNRALDVTGLSWMDREWATNQLEADQVGWDWFSLQGGDGSDLMLYQIRKRDGTMDAYSKGMWFAAEADPVVVGSGEFTLRPMRTWSPPDADGAGYPVEWRVEIPGKAISVTVRAVMDAQELVFEPMQYWEGAVTFEGTREGRPWQGRGYLEMTGYRSVFRQLQAP